MKVDAQKLTRRCLERVCRPVTRKGDHFTSARSDIAGHALTADRPNSKSRDLKWAYARRKRDGAACMQIYVRPLCFVSHCHTAILRQDGQGKMPLRCALQTFAQWMSRHTDGPSSCTGNIEFTIDLPVDKMTDGIACHCLSCRPTSICFTILEVVMPRLIGVSMFKATDQ